MVHVMLVIRNSIIKTPPPSPTQLFPFNNSKSIGPFKTIFLYNLYKYPLYLQNPTPKWFLPWGTYNSLNINDMRSKKLKDLSFFLFLSYGRNLIKNIERSLSLYLLMYVCSSKIERPFPLLSNWYVCNCKKKLKTCLFLSLLLEGLSFLLLRIQIKQINLDDKLHNTSITNRLIINYSFCLIRENG